MCWRILITTRQHHALQPSDLNSNSTLNTQHQTDCARALPATHEICWKHFRSHQEVQEWQTHPAEEAIYPALPASLSTKAGQLRRPNLYEPPDASPSKRKPCSSDPHPTSPSTGPQCPTPHPPLLIRFPRPLPLPLHSSLHTQSPPPSPLPPWECGLAGS